MKINGVAIADTFAEAFTMRVARIVITGRTAKWAREAAVKLTGFATSVLGCTCEPCDALLGRAPLAPRVVPAAPPPARPRRPRLRRPPPPPRLPRRSRPAAA